MPFARADADDAVLVDAFRRHLLDGDDVRPLAELVGGVDHLCQAAALVLHEDVRQQQRERLVADEFARAPHRVAKPERLLLPREARGAGLRQLLPQEIERLVLLPFEQRHLQLELAVEVVLDDALVAAGDEDEVLDAGLPRLVDDMLDQRPVDHRQHLLRHRLGRRQEAGAEPGDGKDGFADEFHALACCEN